VHWFCFVFVVAGGRSAAEYLLRKKEEKKHPTKNTLWERIIKNAL
jgi:hypothetical protein